MRNRPMALLVAKAEASFKRHPVRFHVGGRIAGVVAKGGRGQLFPDRRGVLSLSQVPLADLGLRRPAKPLQCGEGSFCPSPRETRKGDQVSYS